jgi:glutathione synthase/RimK-type ligase-like ATP-grasp enzyme
LLVAAFARLGADAEIVPWGSGTDWSRFDAVVIRGTWDYVDDREGFLAWASSLGCPVANQVDVLRWNTDKRYLGDLEGAGVPVVPTSWGAGDGLPEGEFVVKPAVSAGARMSARYRGRADWAPAAAHVAAIEAGGDVAMVQPFVASVDTVGETGTYVFGGEVTHAIRKMGILDAGAAPSPEPTMSSVDRVGPAPVDPVLAEFALRVVAASPGPLVYARVDTVPTADGSPLLIELEATEPFLFLEHAPDPASAADRFATAVATWLGS